MGQELAPDHLKLYHRVDEVLHYLWDPIGVAKVPEARDEYYSYLPHVFSLLIHNAKSEEIVGFLVKTATETIGLSGGQHVRQNATEITVILQRYRDLIL